MGRKHAVVAVAVDADQRFASVPGGTKAAGLLPAARAARDEDGLSRLLREG